MNEALDRLDAPLADNHYLVGNQFTVADLIVASLLAPWVQPEQAPFQIPCELPDGFQELCTSFAGRPTIDWVSRIYARHRM